MQLRASNLESASQEAAIQFSKQAHDHEQQSQIIRPHNSVRDVQFAVKDCAARYEGRKPDSKALKWLRQLSEKIVFYEGVVDVIIQQHPEAVSLIWGGMKFFFMVRYQICRSNAHIMLILC